MEDVPRTHFNGNPQSDSTDDSRNTPENFTGRIIFMSMFNDIVGDAKGTMKYVKTKQRQLNIMQKDSFPRDHWSFPGLGSEKKWYGTCDCKPDGPWNRTAEKMLLNFAETEHPVFRGTSALERERGDLRSKGSGKKSTH